MARLAFFILVANVVKHAESIRRQQQQSMLEQEQCERAWSAGIPKVCQCTGFC